jgi:hypothetical protein
MPSSRFTKSKGQDFGLAVVKRIIDAMDGTATFESEQGKGTKIQRAFSNLNYFLKLTAAYPTTLEWSPVISPLLW